MDRLPPLLLALCAGISQAGLRSVDEEADKLRRIRAIKLPPELLDDAPSRMLLAQQRRVAAEELHESRLHPTRSS